MKLKFTSGKDQFSFVWAALWSRGHAQNVVPCVQLRKVLRLMNQIPENTMIIPICRLRSLRRFLM